MIETTGVTDPDASRRIYFDTNIFIDAHEGTLEKANCLKPVFEAAKRKPKRIVTSELTIAELFGRGWAWQTRFYLDLLVYSNFIDLRPVTRDILADTGPYRRAARETNRKVALPDAMHIVTAIKARCSIVFSSDRRFVVPAPLVLLSSDENGIDALLKALDA